MQYPVKIESTDLQKIAEVIEYERNRQGLSKNQLAISADTSGATLDRIQVDIRPREFFLVMRILSALGIQMMITGSTNSKYRKKESRRDLLNQLLALQKG